MAEFEKIENLDQLERWLTTQDIRMSRTIAARAALRALPDLMPALYNPSSAKLLLAGLRATLISGAASTFPSQDLNRVKKASYAASASVEPYGDSFPAASAAAYASTFDFSAAAAADTVYISTRSARAHSDNSAAAALSAAASDAALGETHDPHQIFNHPLWSTTDDDEQLLQQWQAFEARPDPEGIWSFWRDWYRGMLNGEPLDWGLQLQVALIDNAIWEAGPEAIAKEIARIRQVIEANGHEENKPYSEQPVSAATAEAMAQLLQTNRDAISLTTASLLEQIAEFREKMRGNNHLESEFREEILAFLDQLSEKLRNLVKALPAVAETTDTKAGEKAVLWLRDFKAHFFKEAAAYASPENIAKSAIPTGIILGCTAVGSLVGMPVPGTIVGGLITGQLKPGKAADDLLKPKSSGGD